VTWSSLASRREAPKLSICETQLQGNTIAFRDDDGTSRLDLSIAAARCAARRRRVGLGGGRRLVARRHRGHGARHVRGRIAGRSRGGWADVPVARVLGDGVTSSFGIRAPL
jgi:hypothetical protein